MSRFYLSVFLFLSLALSGCTSTHAVQRSDREALAQLTDELQSRRVEIVLEDRREPATHVRIAQDSTRWGLGNAARSVPTDAVGALVVNPRPQNMRTGFLAGALAYGVLTAAACSELSTRPGCYVLFVPLGALSGGVIFSLYGALGSKVTEYRLVD